MSRRGSRAEQLSLFPEPAPDFRRISSDEYYGTVDEVAARIMAGGDSGRSSSGWKYGPGLAKTYPAAPPRKAGAA